MRSAREEDLYRFGADSGREWQKSDRRSHVLSTFGYLSCRHTKCSSRDACKTFTKSPSAFRRAVQLLQQAPLQKGKKMNFKHSAWVWALSEFFISPARTPGKDLIWKKKTERVLGKSLSKQRCLVPGENRSLLFLPQLVRGSVRMKIIRIPSSHTRATIKELEGENLSTARLVNWIIFMIAKKLDSLAWKMKETRLQLCVISDVNAILWGQPALRDAKWLLCRMPSKLNDIVRPCAKHKTLTQNIRKDKKWWKILSWLNSIFTGHNLRKTCKSFG